MRITRENYKLFLKEIHRVGRIINPTEIDMAIANNNQDIDKAFKCTNIKAIELDD